MGISLDSSERITGYRPATFKNALRGYARTFDPGNLIDFKTVFPLRRDGAIVFEECLDRGLIDPETLRITAVGETLARAKLQARTPLAKADLVLERLLDRATAMNADNNAIRQVDEIWLFGSVLRREATVGDIDLAICTSRKEPSDAISKSWQQEAIDQISAFGEAPQALANPWEMEAWLERRALYGPARHPLLAGAQDDASDLAELAVPCRLIFDRKRGGCVDDPVSTQHPASSGGKPALLPPAGLPSLTPKPIRPMDGRWLAAYSARGEVSPFDIYRGWTTESRRMFGGYPEHLRIFGDGSCLDDFPWTPKALKRPGLDGRSSLLVVDATERWGLSVILERRIEFADAKWILHAALRDVQLHRARKHVDLASTASLVGAISLILAVDAERMLRRATEQSVVPNVAVSLKRQTTIAGVQQHVLDPIYENLRTRSVAIEPEGKTPVIMIAIAE